MGLATDIATVVEGQVLSAVDRSQKAVLRGVELWADAVGRVTPEPPRLPFAPQLPEVEKAVDHAHEFAGQLLSAQRDFTNSVVATAFPVYFGTPEKKKTKKESIATA